MCKQKSLQRLIYSKGLIIKSGWQDSNLRPPAPKAVYNYLYILMLNIYISKYDLYMTIITRILLSNNTFNSNVFKVNNC